MKKTIAMMLIMLLAFSAVSALADLQPAQVVGAWYSDGTGQYGTTQYLLTGDYFIEFNRDYSARLSFNGVERNCTWKIFRDEIHLKDDATVWAILKYQDGSIVYRARDFSTQENRTIKLTLLRERTCEPAVVPEIKTAESEDEFFGNWEVAYSVTPYGLQLPDEKNAGLKIKVEFAQIVLVDGENTLYALTNFVDGKLTFDASELNMGKGTIIAELAENGYARLTMDGVDPAEFNHYLRNVDADDAAPTEEATEAPAAE